MKYTIPTLIMTSVILTTLTPPLLTAQVTGGDLLNETPLSWIPEEMTFEEYQDMNRRLTVGLALASIPIPGMIHFYAGEKKTGWTILGTAAAGITGILAGALLVEEGDFPESDFDLLVINARRENERRFEKIPAEVTRADTTFRLQEIFRESKGFGTVLVLLGAVTLAADLAYDFVHGVKIIEEKRDQVRFKYGRLLNEVSIAPDFDPQLRSAGVKLSMGF